MKPKTTTAIPYYLELGREAESLSEFRTLLDELVREEDVKHLILGFKERTAVLVSQAPDATDILDPLADYVEARQDADAVIRGIRKRLKEMSV